MKICIFGVGYVGLITGLGFAELGHTVMCYDVDSAKIKKLLGGIMPIFEAGAEKLLAKYLDKKIGFTDEIQVAIGAADILFVCINVEPVLTAKSKPDTLIVLIKKIQSFSDRPKIIVLKSTVAVGTYTRLQTFLDNSPSKHKMHLVSNPEFLSEGEALKNFFNPYRIILASDSPSALKQIVKIYQPILRQKIPLVLMDPTSAELTKHAANCMLATRVAFINEFSGLCELTSANIEDVKKGIGLDPRIGPQFLNPSAGYGGSCLPKDISAMISLAKNNKHAVPLLVATESSNKLQTRKILSKIESLISRHKCRNVAIWGLSYKPGTDDIRNSAGVSILQSLLKKKLNFNVYDPAAKLNLQKLSFNKNLQVNDDLYETLRNSDILIILTEWPEFVNANLNKIKASMKKPIIFDTKNIFFPSELKKRDFIYSSLGRKS